ncbi:MAG: hypothetical protein HZC42_06905 [Candidatus Eisenbacteria bacterium]|nr:hypothetical protein [Candidatus Eisenbacteria bacterium]
MKRNLVGTIVGPKGCGKSTLVQEIVREHRRVVILDYVGEYGAQLGAQACWGFDDCLAALELASRAQEFRLSLRDTYGEEKLALLHVLFELERYLLVIEEAPTVCGPGVMPLELQRIVAIGRHRGISQLYVAQRPSMVNRLVTSQSDVLVAFRQHEPRDVEYLVEACGARMEAVRELAPFAILVGGDPARAPRAVRARLRAQGTPPTKPLDGHGAAGVTVERAAGKPEKPRTT